MKIDKSFVDDITCNSESFSLIKVLTMLAKTFKLDIIAEGVESNEQAELLNQAACYNHQGYLYSKPQPANKLTKWLINYKTKTERFVG